jgi:hypothetical protein
MTGRTTDLDQLVPTLARQGIDAREREIVVEETRTTIRRIIIRAPAPEPTTNIEKEPTSWSDADPR